MGRLQEYLEKTFGCRITSLSRQVTLGALPIQIAQNSPDRFQIVIMNLSVNNIYIGFDSAVAITKGILLAANGGQVGFNARDDGDISGRTMYGVAAAGAPVIYVVETVALE